MRDLTKGIDVSGWQGVVHWPAVANSDVEFVFIKASEGVGFVDPKFERNWARANEVGLLVGAYHFARVSHDRGVDLLDDARAEAEHFWGVLDRVGYEHGVHLPPPSSTWSGTSAPRSRTSPAITLAAGASSSSVT